MKSSTGLRLVVVAALGVLPFLSCTNADVEFTSVSSAGNSRLPRAGAAGNDSGVAGNAEAGDAGAVGEAGEGGATASSGAGGVGHGGMTNAGAGQGGNGGRGGDNVGGRAGHGAGGAGGVAGRGGTGGGGTGGSAGRAGGGAGGSAGRAGGGAGGSAGRGGGGAGGSAGRGGGGAGGSAATGGVGGGFAGTGGAGASGMAGVAGLGGAAGAAAVCGNNLLEKGEQCDDGNNKNLDACDASCSFEQSQRANAIEQRFVTSSFCTKNAFGVAFAGVGQTALQAILNQRVENGSLSLLFAFRGLNDLSGTSTEAISLGVAYGTPSVASNYDGTNDLDWWYSPAVGQADSSGVLVSNSTASLTGGVLNATPGSIQLPLLSGALVTLSSSKVRLYVGDSSAPLTSSGVAPGHLAAEHLRASLVSFASGGPPPPGNADPGQLCGNLSAASLAAVAIPAAFATGGASHCSEGYPPTRSLLDLLIGGCTVGGDLVVAPTQPDQADPDAPVGGNGAPYQLLLNSSNALSACRDKLDRPVSVLSTCLSAAAYSSAYRLKTGRVIIK